MKTLKEQAQTQTRKRAYVRPEIKKRERINEVTEGLAATVTTAPVAG